MQAYLGNKGGWLPRGQYKTTRRKGDERGLLSSSRRSAAR